MVMDIHISFIVNSSKVNFISKRVRINLFAHKDCFISTQLNDFICDLTQIFLFNINCLLTVKWYQVLLFNTNYSIQYYLFTHCQMIPSIAM